MKNGDARLQRPCLTNLDENACTVGIQFPHIENKLGEPGLMYTSKHTTLELPSDYDLWSSPFSS